MEWTLWLMVSKNGTAPNTDWRQFTVTVGDKQSSKRRRYRIAINPQTSLAVSCKETQDMQLKHPGLLQEVERAILAMDLAK